jgi:hypothetical protein
MTTGMHTVRDIRCAKCGETLGWKYGAFAFFPSYFPSLLLFRRVVVNVYAGLVSFVELEL